MPTQQPRLNLTLDAEIMKMLKGLARKTHSSVASVAKDLLIDGLELQEDIYFSELSDKRFTQTRRWHSHEDAWK